MYFIHWLKFVCRLNSITFKRFLSNQFNKLETLMTGCTKKLFQTLLMYLRLSNFNQLALLLYCVCVYRWYIRPDFQYLLVYFIIRLDILVKFIIYHFGYCIVYDIGGIMCYFVIGIHWGGCSVRSYLPYGISIFFSNLPTLTRFFGLGGICIWQNS